MVARTPIAVSIAAFVLAGCGDATDSSHDGSRTDTDRPSTATSVSGTVASITDGDTIRVDTGATATERVRLVGIDSPETRDPDVAKQCFGDEATRVAGELMPIGVSVRLETDPTQDVRDRYDRLLAYVYVDDGSVSVNETLVRRGAARVYVYRNRPFAQHAAFTRAEREARDAGRGLWTACPGT